MEKIIVKGGKKLQGEVDISVAKNSVLPIIVATILNPTPIVIKNVPMLEDVTVLINLLRELECEVNFSQITGDLIIDTSNLKEVDANSELIRKMRASFLIMGPMLSRFGRCKISMPGGCNIGSRPIDLHLKGFKCLGIESETGYGYVESKAKRIIGNRVYLDFPSVGATENIMMSAVLAEGTTVIENAAEEPEIWDLARFLNSMGAKITGAGFGRITIEGVESLKKPEPFTPIFDRIEAGTFMVAAAMTSGNVLIKDAIWEHNRPLISKLLEMGVDVKEEDRGIRVKSDVSKLKPVAVKTLPHPGFPTDMQAQFTALMAVVKGKSSISETVFENRFQHLEEMRRMGLHSEILRDTAMIHGGLPLQGARVMSTDLRASAALILTGMVAEGTTTVGKLTHLDRGYYQFHEKLAKLGANISRVSEA